MGKILIIAEKPAQAREYAKVLGVKNKGEGYLENEKYVISWCIGHLLELERPEVYMELDKVGKRWSLNRLPVLPDLESFRRAIKPNTRKQYQVIKHLLKSSEIEQVICGTDADREGQLLFQEVWDSVKCQKPLFRLWISSLTAEAIMDGMNNLIPASSVAGLAAAGYGRAYADWDFGMNLTEGFTSLFGSFDPIRKKPNVISIGRVQTPTLALLVEREWEIESFIPEQYFEVRAFFESALSSSRSSETETSKKTEYTGRWIDLDDKQKRINKREEAENIVKKTEGKAGKIVKLEQKETQEPAPLLFDLTALTVVASKRYGYSAELVLKLAQSLYEKKAITYPRTDCAYLPEDFLPRLPEHLKAVNQGAYSSLVKEAMVYGVPKGKRVINKITAHHAIIPTTEKILIEKLPDQERVLYDLIVRRFLAIWYPPAKYLQTEVITRVEEEHFQTKGKVILSPGWKQVYDVDLDTKEVSSKSKGKKHREEIDSLGTEEVSDLPPLIKGQEVSNQKVEVEEHSTKPPRRFTQGDLLKAMETAGKQIEDEILRQQMKGKGLGTVATRPAIIESLLERGYLNQERKILVPTQKGKELIILIKERLPKAQLLISPEMTGQMEYKLGKVESNELSLAQYILEVEEAIRTIIDELRTYDLEYGKKPLALGPIKDLAKFKETSKKTNKKTNKQVEDNSPQGENIPQYNIPDILGTCPNCGGGIIEGQKGYGCANWRNGCKFTVWKNKICGKVLTSNQMKSLLKKGRTALIKGFKSKNGKTFAAYLIWEDKVNGKLKFEFESSKAERK